MRVGYQNGQKMTVLDLTNKNKQIIITTSFK